MIGGRPSSGEKEYQEQDDRVFLPRIIFYYYIDISFTASNMRTEKNPPRSRSPVKTVTSRAPPWASGNRMT